MAERFRFRIPWLKSTTPRPTAQSQTPRPPVETTKGPARPGTTIPVQRPQFRPPGIDAVQPSPPQSQAPQQTESQPPPPPPPPSPATTESQAIAQPASPSQATTQPWAAAPQPPSRAATGSQVTSQPASPDRTAPQSRAASVPLSPTRTTWQPQSPSRLAAQHGGQTNSVPSSPSRTASNAQPTISQPRSPLNNSLPTAKETLQLPSVSAQPPSSASEQEVKPEAISDVLSESLKQKGAAQASENEIVATTAPTAPAASQRLESEAVRVELPAYASEPVKEAKDNKDEKNEEKLIREGKISNSVPENEQKESNIATKHLAAGLESSTQTQKLHNLTSHSEPRLQEKEDAYDRKKGRTTEQNCEDIRIVRLTPSNANHLSSGAPQQPVMLTGEPTPPHKEIKDEVSKFIQKLGTGLPNKPGETPISVVTLAGENRGAFMHLGSEPLDKNGSIHIYRRYKINPDDSTGGTTTDAEESLKDGSSKDPSVKEDTPIRAYINSNVQTINNSLLYGSSVNEGNPGVRMTFSCSPTETASSSTKPGPPRTQKAQFNITPAEKLTYEPRVRRRCLRGLFLEPSDSDPDNTEKPRRHGCRYSCGEKSKDTDMGVF